MDGFTQKIIGGNAQALSYAKSLITNPALISTKPFWYIPLEVETFSQNGEAQVSENLVIGAEGKKYITDNVAPGGWSFTLGGYIPGFKIGEITNLYTPGLRTHTELIKKAFKKGSVLMFKDPECWPYNNVVIESLTLEVQKDCKNKKPFQMTLKQIDVLKTSEAQETDTEVSGQPAQGSGAGNTAEVGQTAAQKKKPVPSKAMRWLRGEITWKELLTD